jgi:hypothetical protein
MIWFKLNVALTSTIKLALTSGARCLPSRQTVWGMLEVWAKWAKRFGPLIRAALDGGKWAAATIGLEWFGA